MRGIWGLEYALNVAIVWAVESALDALEWMVERCSTEVTDGE